MKKIKIIPKFFSKAQALNQVSKERQLLKAQGKNKTHKVEIQFAYTFWRTNKWFNQKKFRLPNPTDQDYIITITEISKQKTINMPQTTQKQPQKINTISKQLKTRKPQKETISTPGVHKLNPCPVQTNNSNTSTYSLFTIPNPFFYRSVA
jgi:hypothetical protein